MQTIGMLGGMSWESSAEYYRLANELVRDRPGGLHSARVVMVSVDFADLEALQVAGRWEEAGQMLAEAARGVQAAGADLLLLCTNTMHKVADQVQGAVSIPLLHLADATAAAVTRAGVTSVGLLGTAFTMEQSFYRDRLAAHGLTVLVPTPADRAVVHRVIYDELCRGVLRDESRQAYRDVDRVLGLASEALAAGEFDLRSAGPAEAFGQEQRDRGRARLGCPELGAATTSPDRRRGQRLRNDALCL